MTREEGCAGRGLAAFELGFQFLDDPGVLFCEVVFFEWIVFEIEEGDVGWDRGEGTVGFG